MFEDEVAGDSPAEIAPAAADHPAGELRRRSIVAFGVGVAALSGLAVAAAFGVAEPTTGIEAFPMTTCCINPNPLE